MSFICGTDFGENSIRATEIAARLAAKAGQPLVIVHALALPSLAYMAGEPFFVPSQHLSRAKREMEQEADATLASEAKRLAESSGAKVVPRLSIGSPDLAILEAAAEMKPDLIVAGTHGRSAPARWLVGSTADRLARRTSDPLLVVRDPSDGLAAWSKGEKTLKVLVGVSFDDSFDAVARAVKALARWSPCDVSIAYAHSPPATLIGGSIFPQPPVTTVDLHASTVRAVSRLAKARGLVVEEGRVNLLTGSPAAALVEEAARGSFDLLVVGTHGRRGLDRALLGSVALGVLHHAPCPILIAPVT